MKFSEFKRYLSFFILAVAIIIVYKTFDNLAGIFSVAASFLKLVSPIIYAFIIAFLLYPLCESTETFIENKMPLFFKKRARGISVISVYVFVFLVLGFSLYATLPLIIDNIIDFIKTIPVLLEQIVDKINKSKFINIDLKRLDKYIDFKEFLSKSGWLNMGVYTSKIVSFSMNFVNIILSVITSVYILLERKALVSTFSELTSVFDKKEKLAIIKRYLKKAVDFTYKYMFCILLDAVIVFFICLVVFLIMDIRYALVLALMIGLFNIVPHFGSLIAFIISVVITLVTSNFSTTLIFAVVLFAVQQVDGNVIQPHIVKDKLDVSPFWVLVGILIGGGLFGIWGILLAVPVLAVLKLVIQDYLADKR